MGGFRMCISPIQKTIHFGIRTKRFYTAMCSSLMLEIDQKAINFFWDVCVCALLLSQCCRFKFQFIYLELETVKKHDKSNFKCVHCSCSYNGSRPFWYGFVLFVYLVIIYMRYWCCLFLVHSCICSLFNAHGCETIKIRKLTAKKNNNQNYWENSKGEITATDTWMKPIWDLEVGAKKHRNYEKKKRLNGLMFTSFQIEQIPMYIHKIKWYVLCVCTDMIKKKNDERNKSRRRRWWWWWWKIKKELTYNIAKHILLFGSWLND